MVTDFALPFAAGVIGDLLGIPTRTRDRIRVEGRELMSILEVQSTPEALDAADHAIVVLTDCFTEVITSRRNDVADGVIDALAAADESESLAEEDVVDLTLLLFIAGLENVTNMLGNSLVALAMHPSELRHLRERPDLLDTVPDELIRFDSPVQLTTRVAVEPVSVGGVVVPPGEPVVVLIGAANRDPLQFHDPERLDVERSEVRTLGFGGGVHHCIGFALARAEVGVVASQLVRMAGSLELTGDVEYPDRLTLRGPWAAPVALKAVVVPAPARTHRRVTASRHTQSDHHAQAHGSVRPSSGSDHEWRTAFRAARERAPRPPGQELDMLVQLLGRISLFSGCTTSELNALAATAYPIDFEAGEALFTEGGAASDCFVVAEGEAVVTIDGTTVATVGPDKVIGERGVLVSARRGATVIACTHMVTYAVARERLLALVAASPGAREAMRRDLRERYGDELASHMAIPLPAHSRTVNYPTSQEDDR